MQKSIKLFTAFLLLLPLTVLGQTDTTYLFRFVPAKDIFFVSYSGNASQLQRLSEVISRNRAKIESGEIPLYVDGYCHSMSTEQENRRIATLRSNRVKSELIVKENLKEVNFRTHNHTMPYGKMQDVVVISLRIPEAVPVEPENAGGVTEAPKPEEPEPTVQTVTEATVAPAEEKTVTEEREPKIAKQNTCRLALRANLLHWATLTPDFGIEWRINRHVGILVNGSWTSWDWDNKNRCYALWKVSPEVRYYIGKEARGYFGAMYHLGEFNCKLGATGRQGDYQGGGITGGYLLKLNRALSLDFHAGIGYTRAEYDKYKVTDGVRVREGSGSKNYWGVNQLGVTLVWKLNQ